MEEKMVKIKPVRSLNADEYEEIFSAVLNKVIEPPAFEAINTEAGESSASEKNEFQVAADLLMSIQKQDESTPVMSSDDEFHENLYAPPTKRRKKIISKRFVLSPKQLKYSINDSWYHEKQAPSQRNVFLKNKELNEAYETKKYKGNLKETTKDRLLTLNSTYVNNSIGTWVQCCDKSCNKWRYLEDVKEPFKVPKIWYCSMNKDPSRNCCDKPEDKYHNLEFVYSKFVPGSIVWAKLTGYPWWPAMIEDDPDTEEFMWTNDFANIPTHYHVVFLDENTTRAWIKISNVCPYFGNEKWSKVSKNKFTFLLKAAEERATEALGMSLEQRFKKFSFAHRYKGRWPRAEHDFSGKKCKTNEKSAKFQTLKQEVPQLNITNCALNAKNHSRETLEEADALLEELDDLDSFNSLDFDILPFVESEPSANIDDVNDYCVSECKRNNALKSLLPKRNIQSNFNSSAHTTVEMSSKKECISNFENKVLEKEFIRSNKNYFQTKSFKKFQRRPLIEKPVAANKHLSAPEKYLHVFKGKTNILKRRGIFRKKGQTELWSDLFDKKRKRKVKEIRFQRNTSLSLRYFTAKYVRSRCDVKSKVVKPYIRERKWKNFEVNSGCIEPENGINARNSKNSFQNEECISIKRNGSNSLSVTINDITTTCNLRKQLINDSRHGVLSVTSNFKNASLNILDDLHTLEQNTEENEIKTINDIQLNKTNANEEGNVGFFMAKSQKQKKIDLKHKLKVVRKQRDTFMQPTFVTKEKNTLITNKPGQKILQIKKKTFQPPLSKHKKSCVWEQKSKKSILPKISKINVENATCCKEESCDVQDSDFSKTVSEKEINMICRVLEKENPVVKANFEGNTISLNQEEFNINEQLSDGETDCNEETSVSLKREESEQLSDSQESNPFDAEE